MTIQILSQHHQGLLSFSEEKECGTLIQASAAAQTCLEENIQLDGWSTEDLEAVTRLGDKAFNTMVTHNIALAAKVAHSFEKRTQTKIDLEDITQNAIVGLIIAIRKYNPSRGVKFASMAYPWIELSARRATNRIATPVALPEDKITLSAKIFKTKHQLLTDGEQHPNLYSEIASILQTQYTGKKSPKITEELVRDIHNGISFSYSLDAKPYENNDNDTAMSNFIAENMGSNTTTLEDDTLRLQADRTIADELSKLEARERAVMSNRYQLPMADGFVVSRRELRRVHKVSADEEERIHDRVLAGLRPRLVRVGIENQYDYVRGKSNFSF